jgi:hypothetical protein
MAQTLFTSQTPTSGNVTNGNSISLGNYLTPAVDGFATHIGWYFPVNPQPGGEAVKAALFRTSDSAKLAADVVFASPGSPGTWNWVELAAPIPMSAGVQYCPTVRSPSLYVASTGGDSPWPLTNGDLSAPASAGRFEDDDGDGSVQFPSDSFNNGCYFVDVMFSTGDDPAEGSAALGLGLAVAATGGADAEGSAALGLNLAVAVAGARRAQGAVTLGLNLAFAGSGARDSLGSAALGLDLSVSTSGARSASGTSALSLNLALAARGSDGEAGRPVAAWPYGAREVSGYPWTPRPVKSFSGEVG